MSRKNIIKVTDLDVKLTELLDGYDRAIQEGVDYYSEQAVKELAQITKKTAPKGVRKSFAKNITSGVVKKTRRSTTYAWYVKAPDHRLTHLLVHGHATKDGGRTRGNPFLKNALDQVLPAFEESIQSVFDWHGKSRH